MADPTYRNGIERVGEKPTAVATDHHQLLMKKEAPIRKV